MTYTVSSGTLNLTQPTNLLSAASCVTDYVHSFVCLCVYNQVFKHN